jgi:hypothetical protein
MYSSAVSLEKVNTLYVDPVNHNNNRTEFRLGDKGQFYLPNMCLLNVGAVAPNHPYNQASGSLAIIKDIYLYDGKTELSSTKGLQTWLAWKNLNNTPSYNVNFNHHYNGSNIGLVNQYDKEIETPFTNRATNTAENTTYKGSLMLVDVFPFLKALASNGGILPAKVMPNLRIVIEYNSDARLVIGVDNANITSISQPLLKVNVVDEEKGKDLIDRGMGLFSNPINWMENERDEYHLAAGGNDAGAQGVEVSNTKKVNGFNNKNVRNILMIKQLADPAAAFTGNNIIGYGNNASFGFFRGKYQVRCNGMDLFPRDGIVGDNERLGMLYDLYGDLNSVPYGNGQAQLPALGEDAVFGANSRGRMGQNDYVAFRIGREVKDLQFNIKRTTLEDTAGLRPESLAMNVILYGEVMKQLVIENGEYNLSYV